MRSKRQQEEEQHRAAADQRRAETQHALNAEGLRVPPGQVVAKDVGEGADGPPCAEGERRMTPKVDNDNRHSGDEAVEGGEKERRVKREGEGSGGPVSKRG